MADLSRDDVAHVAQLARLQLDDAEIEHFTGHLTKILDHAADIASLDLDDVEPTTHPVPMSNVLRDDVVGETLSPEAVLSMAPAADEQRFRVPPILGEAP